MCDLNSCFRFVCLSVYDCIACDCVCVCLCLLQGLRSILHVCADCMCVLLSCFRVVCACVLVLCAIVYASGIVCCQFAFHIARVFILHVCFAFVFLGMFLYACMRVLLAGLYSCALVCCSVGFHSALVCEYCTCVLLSCLWFARLCLYACVACANVLVCF